MQSIMAELGECQLPQSALRAAPEDHWPAWLDPFASAEHSTDTYPWLDQPSTDVLPQQFAQLAPSDPPALASPAELQPAASLDVYEELGLGYSPGGTAHGVYEPLDSMAECEASGDHELGDDESYSPGGTAADGYEPFLTTGMQHSQGRTCSPGGVHQSAISRMSRRALHGVCMHDMSLVSRRALQGVCMHGMHRHTPL